MKRNRFARAALPALLLTLALAAPAGADTIADGRLSLELDRGLQRTLRAGGAAARGLKPAVGRPKAIDFPLKRGGGVEVSGKGRLLAAGALRFGAKGGGVVFHDLVLDTAFGTLSANVDGERVAVATVSGLSSERHGFAVDLGLRRLALTQRAAATIDSALGIPRLLRGGDILGSIAAVARFERLRLIDGQAYLSFAPSLAAKLESLKVETEPLGGWLYAGNPPAPVLTDAAGEIALDLTGGSFMSKDGFVLVQPATSRVLALQRIEFDLDSGEIAAGRTPLGTFTLPVVHKNAYTGVISTPSSPVLISAELATLLNGSFADPIGVPGPFVAGEPFGAVALLLRVHGTPRES